MKTIFNVLKVNTRFTINRFQRNQLKGGLI
jgi:hypothetical protein